MSVAVTCNVSDGLILGVDSAVTISFGQRVGKVYDDAEKLFQLGDKRVGIAIYGLAGLGERSLGSFIREFESTDPGGVMKRDCEIGEITEALRSFFMESYRRILGPPIEQFAQKKFDDIPTQDMPMLGLVVGGFSSEAFLSEVWQIHIPDNHEPSSGRRIYGQGEFGVSWHATSAPIQRYLKGIDFGMLAELDALVQRIIGRAFTPEEQKEVNDIISRYQYQFVYDSMPIGSAINCVRFLVDMVISHFRYVQGDSIVGGKPKLGVVTYKGEKFQLLD